MSEQVISNDQPAQEIVQSNDTAQQLFGGPGGGPEHQAAPVAPAEPSTPAAPATATTTTQQGAGGLTTEQIQELVRSTASESVKAAQAAVAQPERQLSQQEINQMLQVFEVTPQHAQELVQALGINAPPEAVAKVAQVLNLLLEGKTRQALTMASVQLEAFKRNDFSKVQNQLNPVLDMVTAQKEMALRGEFFEKNPDLKGYEPVLEMIYTQMKNENLQFRTKEEAFNAVKSRAQAVLAKLPNAQSNGNGRSQQQATNGGAARSASSQRMSTVSAGGQGGGSPGGKQMTLQESQARKLFGA